MPRAESPISFTRVLLVDDFEPWREQVGSILQTRPELRVVAEVADGLQAVQKAQELKPDLILLDIGLPNLSGIEAAKIIRERCPKSKIVFVTENTDSEIRAAAMGSGASGYVVKTNIAHELLDAIAGALRNA
jgi:two-component system, NarL family, nitrate/nitrite response regulator NarL